MCLNMLDVPQFPWQFTVENDQHQRKLLVVDPTPLKNMTSSVGIIATNKYIYIYRKLKMFQTTNKIGCRVSVRQA